MKQGPFNLQQLHQKICRDGRCIQLKQKANSMPLCFGVWITTVPTNLQKQGCLLCFHSNKYIMICRLQRRHPLDDAETPAMLIGPSFVLPTILCKLSEKLDGRSLQSDANSAFNTCTGLQYQHLGPQKLPHTWQNPLKSCCIV